ncbi:MAG: hypothetical protein AAGA72_03250 [Pseudomonadota bacterium]
MKTHIISAIAVMALSGCASALKLENVAGTWSCPRIDGVCADTSAIDAGLTDRAATGSAIVGVGEAVGAQFMTISAEGERAYQPISTLARTMDEVARIVLAPTVDSSGHYHGARELFAVMKNGSWVETPVSPEPATGPALLTQPKKSNDTEQVKTDPADERPSETASLSNRTVTSHRRVVTRTAPPTPTLSPRAPRLAEADDAQ